MQLGLDGKVGLVMGASQGLGRATALRLAEEGAHVAAVARNPSTLEEVAKTAANGGLDVVTLPGDATEISEVRRIVQDVMDRFGRIDILVNTIGVCKRAEDVSGTEDLWQEAYDSVLMAAVRTCREVVPIMRRQGAGAIVNVSAMSIRHYIPQLAHYSAMKIALAHYTKNLARACALDNIRVNGVMPGWIASEQVEQLLQKRIEQSGLGRQETFVEWNKELGTTYCPRMGEPEEYADVVAYLVSDRASYVSGVWLNVDGGSDF